VKTEYLLRFDDLCPTMDRGRWGRFVPLLERYGIKPILAVVPENHDPELMVAAEDAGFWHEMRQWQRRGAAIGLHGYRHLCQSSGGGLIPLHRQTEFAGVAEEQQRAWIETGLEILRGHGLEARVWVGPRHGTDVATVQALEAAGITVISDGLWRRPMRWHGAVWIPQQLWEPREMPEGVWTICLHAHTASEELVAKLERFLELHADAFTTVERVLVEWPVRKHGVREWGWQSWWLAKKRVRQGIRSREKS
jgi:hypothetical protein